MRLSTTEARGQFADIINRVRYAGERIELHRRDKLVGAIVSAEDLRALEELEDRLDVLEALEARKETENIPWAEAKGILRGNTPSASKGRRSGPSRRSRPKTASASKR